MIVLSEVIKRFPKRFPDANKGDFGHVLVAGGSYGYTGAPYFASQGALLSGSGLVTLAVGKSIYPILAVKCSEVMVRPFFETKDASLSLFAENDILSFSEKCTSMVMGPGMSMNRETQELVRNIVAKNTKPLVLDADGLNAFEGHAEKLREALAPLVLTPHPGEMARLIGRPKEEIKEARKDIALTFANEYNTVLVLKGQGTVVANPKGDFYVNDTGNPGMATGGTGDVLAGVIGGFIAQGMEPFEAAVLAVYFHGLAGDEAAKDKGFLSLTATDLLLKLPKVLTALA